MGESLLKFIQGRKGRVGLILIRIELGLVFFVV